MTLNRRCLIIFAALSLFPFGAQAAGENTLKDGLAAHKAVYDIDLIATHSGSQIINIRGQMTYEWKPSCDAWLTDHRFKLYYEYADAPGMRIVSDFSTYETFDGKQMQYTSRRARDGEMYQEIRGSANVGDLGGKAIYSMPEKLKYELAKGTLFPVSHTVELIKHAQAGDKFYNAEIFDGSDEDGPIEINTFIGAQTKVTADMLGNSKIDASLLQGKAWKVRMAVFPVKEQEEESDYEMTMLFHENGIISDMQIEYDDFSVRQKLVSLQSIPADSCDPGVPVPKKP